MNNEEKKEYEEILNTLGKKDNPENLKTLHYVKTSVFPQEKKQEHHKNNYFYKFIYYFFKDHLQDKINWKQSIKEILENWTQIITNIVVILFIICSAIYFILCYNISINKWLSSGIVLLITSIVTGSFFIIKIYIENQLSKKEKEMLKEYQTFVKREIKQQSNELEKNQKIIIDWIKKQEKNQQNPPPPNNNQTNQSQ